MQTPTTVWRPVQPRSKHASYDVDSENRRTMARVFPDLFTRQRVRAVGDYSVHLLRALRAAAAPNVADPTVVVLCVRACFTRRPSSASRSRCGVSPSGAP